MSGPSAGASSGEGGESAEGSSEAGGVDMRAQKEPRRGGRGLLNDASKHRVQGARGRNTSGATSGVEIAPEKAAF